MADAVLTQRLLVGGAALAALFLVVLVLVGAFVLLANVVDRFRKADAKVQEILADFPPESAPVRAVLDVKPGLDRLRAAIRDEQQKGD